MLSRCLFMIWLRLQASTKINEKCHPTCNMLHIRSHREGDQEREKDQETEIDEYRVKWMHFSVKNGIKDCAKLIRCECDFPTDRCDATVISFHFFFHYWKENIILCTKSDTMLSHFSSFLLRNGMTKPNEHKSRLLNGGEVVPCVFRLLCAMLSIQVVFVN